MMRGIDKTFSGNQHLKAGLPADFLDFRSAFSLPSHLQRSAYGANCVNACSLEHGCGGRSAPSRRAFHVRLRRKPHRKKRKLRGLSAFGPVCRRPTPSLCPRRPPLCGSAVTLPPPFAGIARCRLEYRPNDFIAAAFLGESFAHRY